MKPNQTPPPRPIRGLTIIPPWGGLIVDGSKPVENRGWEPTPLVSGDFIAIHSGTWAGKKTEQEWLSALDHAKQCGLLASLPILAKFDEIVRGEQGRFYRQRCISYCKTAVTYGAVIGVARLDEVRTTARIINGASDPWFFGPIGWYLRDVVAIEPLARKGELGLWKLTTEEMDVVRERYKASRIASRMQNEQAAP